MSVGKRIGFGFLTIVPSAIVILSQVVAGLILSVNFMLENIDLQMILSADGQLSTEITKYMLAHNDLIVIIYQGICLVAFGIWYFIAYGRKKKRALETPGSKIKLSKIGLVVLLGIMIQISISTIMALLQMVFPHILDEYLELIQQAGLAEPTIITIISAAILAPIVEELCFRGLTMRFARVVWNKKWFYITVQAALFGLIHLNLVQGLYAFVIGLLIGYIMDEFKSLWLCILLHAVINSSSFVLDYLFVWVPSQFYNLATILFAVISTVSVVAIIIILGRGGKNESKAFHS